MPHHRVQVPEQESETARGTGHGRATSEAGSERSEACLRSERTAGGHNDPRSGAAHGQAAGR